MHISHVELPLNTRSFYNKKSNLSINYLEENFYKDTQVDINLDELSEKAKFIQQPFLYGKFLNNAHYMETLDLVLNSTAETIHRGIFYLKYVLPQLKRKYSILDVGPGNGELTKLINKEFENITIVDRCNIALTTNEKILRNVNQHSHLTKIHSSILEANLPNNYYDLAMVSHVLYYIDTTQWLKTAKICYDSLCSGGILVIVLSGAKLGKANLMKSFAGKAIDIDSYAEQCADFFLSPVEIFASKENFYACNLNTMLHIAGFLLYDVHTHATKQELAKYLLKYHRKNKNLFEISTQQEFIVIKKT